MHVAHVLTSWTTDAEGANVPVVPTLPTGCAWEDSTGQQQMLPNPNAVVLRVLATTAYLTTLQADPRVEVLTVEEVTDALAA